MRRWLERLVWWLDDLNHLWSRRYPNLFVPWLCDFNDHLIQRWSIRESIRVANNNPERHH